ncbi:MAG: MgtC/SapB family protein [Stomatobaculum sp.]|nr:MgtC/SapB family protein [Stomatobaculum sp.]
MTFYGLLLDSFTAPQWAELLFRIIVATICGSVIGLERSRRFKDAGIRTHSVVACTAALLMIVSKYGFADLSQGDIYFDGVRGGDPARIAAQVVSGVSFLGAGIIYRDRNFNTKGLTTAAGIWAVAGIGLAIGSGLYLVGVFTTLFIVVLQLFMHRTAVGNEHVSDVRLDIVLQDGSSYPKMLYQKLAEWEALVSETHIRKEDETHTRYIMILKLSQDITDEMLHNLITENEEVVSIKLARDT